MQATKQIAGDIFLYAIGALIALSVFAFVGDAATAIPAIDSRLRPVVGFGFDETAPVQAIVRTSERVCWTIFIEKLRPARVIGYEFFADGGPTSALMPTAAYLVTDAGVSVPNVLETHAVGDRWHRRYCFDIGRRIPDSAAITLSGVAHHSRWPYLWVTATPTPSFTIAPLATRAGR